MIAYAGSAAKAGRVMGKNPQIAGVRSSIAPVAAMVAKMRLPATYNRTTVKAHPRNAMPSRRTRHASSLVTKLAELSFVVPQVVGHRVTRMARAGKAPSARDKREFDLMVAEKMMAFGQSWSAMAFQAARAQQALALSLFTSMWLPTRRNRSATALVAQIQRAAIGVLTKGVAPVHSKAVANARRLARTKLR